jgi:hypothetical protein
MNSYGIKETNPDALQHYGAYCSNSAVDQFKIFSTDTPDEKKTHPELKRFLRNTSFHWPDQMTNGTSENP